MTTVLGNEQARRSGQTASVEEAIPWSAPISGRDMERLILERLPSEPRARDVEALFEHEATAAVSRADDMIQVTASAAPRRMLRPSADWVLKFAVDPTTQHVLSVDARKRSDF